MSVVTWQWHQIIKSTPFCRGLFSDKKNETFQYLDELVNSYLY
jgi:hypothetical protein